MTMLCVSVHEAQANLSRYLEAVERGETVIICVRDVPVAELRPLPRVPKEPRPVGLARGQFTISASFFEPLPGELEAAFRGER